MISFPVLERLVRGKSNAADNRLSKESRFWEALTDCFPELRDPPSGTFQNVAQVFWQGFRNGILHQATFSTKRKMQNGEQDAFFHFEPGSGVAIKVRALKRLGNL